MQEDVAAIGVLMAVGLKMLIQAQVHLGTISTAVSIAQYCMLLPPNPLLCSPQRTVLVGKRNFYTNMLEIDKVRKTNHSVVVVTCPFVS